VRKTIARPAKAGRGKNETKKSARGQKISSPKTPPFLPVRREFFIIFTRIS